MQGSDTKPGAISSGLLEENILFEDNHIIIINKMPSQIVQGDKTGDRPLSELVKDYLKVKYKKQGEVYLGVVHRLDRPVSGAVVFARTSKALTRLNALIKNREVNKTYWAVVKNKPPKESDTLVNYLRRDEAKNKSFVSAKSTSSTQLASLSYTLLASSDNYYLIEIDLQTGRHHQIRAQLAAIGCPIKGDLKYGFPRSNPDASIHLHARKVSFIHPVSLKLLSIIAPLPKDPIWDYFNRQFPDL